MGPMISFLTLIFISLPSFSQNPHYALNSRVEELFVWKLSEELKLTVKEEKEITVMISELNQKKAQSNEKLDGLIQKMSQLLAHESASKELAATLKEYRKALSDYNAISNQEIDQVTKILNLEKSLKYFVVKSDLSRRIRGLLSMPDHRNPRWQEPGKSETQSLGEPKVIEE